MNSPEGGFFVEQDRPARKAGPVNAGESHTPPYFEDLRVGRVSEDAPAITLTEGHAAVHQAILGDRLHLALDAALAGRVLGAGTPIVHPGLVCDVAIGQSTLLTRRVIGNLFYRGLRLRRMPVIGDTLRTSTEVVGLRQNRPKPGRAATGLAALRVRTSDQEGRAVLDFFRCAMLPLRDPEGESGQEDDLEEIGAPFDPEAVAGLVSGWRLEEYRKSVPGPRFEDLRAGEGWAIEGGDVVSSAPELARLSLNVAFAHHDRYAGHGGRRLVYGGHTIGLAAAQLNRALPTLVTIVGWHSCDHLGPVFEEDTLYSEVELESAEPLPGGGGLVHLRSRVRARRDEAETDVLDWRLVGLMP
jgi:acyl dehydratase